MLRQLNIIIRFNGLRFYKSGSNKDLIAIKKSIEIYNSKDKKRSKNKKIEKNNT